MIKKIFLTGIIVSVLGLLTLFLMSKSIDWSVADQHSERVDELPNKEVAIVLGTSKFLGNGYKNLYYQYRIDAVVDLYDSQKVKYILVSGDNSRSDYNEPLLMKEDLIKRGIPSSLVYIDCAGFRTYDSMVRLKEVYGCKSTIIVSQRFHNQRALYISNKIGIDAVALDAKDVSFKYGIRVQAREVLARVKMRLDLITGKEPKFKGEKITFSK